MQNLLLLFLLCVFGCKNNSTSKNTQFATVSENVQNQTKQIDTLRTDTIMSNISLSSQEALNELKGKNREEYARKVLKQFTYCNCLFEAFRADSIFTSTDQSNGFMIFNKIIHKEEVIDSLKILVKQYVKWIDTASTGPTNAKNYSLLCLDLYESNFLDSVIRHFDPKILLKE